MKMFFTHLLKANGTSDMNKLVVYGRVRPEVEEIIESAGITEEQLIDFMNNHSSSVPGLNKTIFFLRYGLPIVYFLIGVFAVTLFNS